MRLHYAPNTIAVAAAITLEEAGLTYEPVRVDFASGEQSGDTFRAINPKGRVPALETEGTILTETGAILEYIAAKAPAAKLVPDTPLHAAHMRSAMFYLASTMHVNHAHKMRGHRWASEQSSFDDMARHVPQTMTASTGYIETHMLRGPYCLGNELSIADPYLFAICMWLEGDGVDLAAFPAVTRFMKTVETRASVKTIRDKGMLTL